ncbi:hypothetical protein [Deinococcus cellulosilyticus]|uniref:Uncharacterized protein n=1 Tax=Deinococcus cellulosilyticus (strain DSM 18568 / NBRC 106333 / KACC 11606 / 5516J-15) TaxID=1223518 RepID=A0A511N0I8_DEIC1|nr:hypothetical protein [Deinococcus cellulosilyticus]GEM45947.1 hypothetical protein DC3_15820 [Deinococcus cellulosilyticus NBRC 106333 = KACC 11606]
MMKRLIMLGMFSLTAAQAADWDVTALLNNLKRQGKIQDVQVDRTQQVNQKRIVNHQVMLRQGKEQNTFVITGKTSAGNLIFRQFDLQVDNFMTIRKGEVFSKQAGYVQAVLLGLSQVCFAFSDQENAAVSSFFRQTLNRYGQQGKSMQTSKTFASVTAAVRISDQKLQFTIENRVAVRKDQCSLLE